MLQQISWSEYWTIIIIFIVFYEAAILLLFYRKELLRLAKRKSLVMPAVSVSSSNHRNEFPEEAASYDQDEEDDHYDDEEENLIPYASDLAASIKELIGQAAENGYAKEELCFGLEQRIKDYPQLKGTSHQRDINTLINVECKTKCAIHLGAGELDKLWMS